MIGIPLEELDISATSHSTSSISGMQNDLTILWRMLLPVQVWIRFLRQPHTHAEMLPRHSRVTNLPLAIIILPGAERFAAVWCRWPHWPWYVHGKTSTVYLLFDEPLDFYTFTLRISLRSMCLYQTSPTAMSGLIWKETLLYGQNHVAMSERSRTLQHLQSARSKKHWKRPPRHPGSLAISWWLTSSLNLCWPFYPSVSGWSHYWQKQRKMFQASPHHWTSTFDVHAEVTTDGGEQFQSILFTDWSVMLGFKPIHKTASIIHVMD